MANVNDDVPLMGCCAANETGVSAYVAFKTVLTEYASHVTSVNDSSANNSTKTGQESESLANAMASLIECKNNFYMLMYQSQTSSDSVLLRQRRISYILNCYQRMENVC